MESSVDGRSGSLRETGRLEKLSPDKAVLLPSPLPGFLSLLGFQIGSVSRLDLILDPSYLASVDVGKSPDIPYVYVRHHGEVQNYKPLQVVTACSLDIYNFPFDVQNCSLTFTSWLHTSE